MTDVHVEASSEGLSFAVSDGVTPADLVAELAKALPERDGEEYLVYEHDGQWILVSGVRTLIELDSDELRVVTDGVVNGNEEWDCESVPAKTQKPVQIIRVPAQGDRR